jgi:hypothetical protein
VTVTAVLALATVAVIRWDLLVPLADELEHHDVSSAKRSLSETAMNNAPGRLLTLALGCSSLGRWFLPDSPSARRGARSS